MRTLEIALSILLLSILVIVPGLASTSLLGQDFVERELIRDPHFQNGFVLISPQPGQRIPYGTLTGLIRQGAPVWDLDQWSSKYPLHAETSPLVSESAYRYTNLAKIVSIGKPGSAEADLSLAVRGNVEYGIRARTNGEPWVHLLALQPIENPPSLASLSRARLRVEARLITSRKFETPDYSPHLHAAQFQIFFSVQNRNRQSPGYGQYLWFGIPIYDDRHRIPMAHTAQDTGGTQMFIFTPPGQTFTDRSAHDRDWITIDQDLLPLMRGGLETAWAQGFLKDSRSLNDYRIAEMNLGWEAPGIFNVEMQIRNLSLLVRTDR